LGLSIIFPNSFCPNCKVTIKWYDNIPILSYILLSGRCRNCKIKISIIYPIVEFLCGLICVLLYFKFGLSISFFIFLNFFFILLVVSFIDIKTTEVPDVLSYYLIISGVVLSFLNPVLGVGMPLRVINSVVGGIRFGSSIWGVAGVVALAHDVFLTIGFLTLLGKEITITVIAAILTLAGYSINDTIVIFDRIRENIKLMRKETLERIINISINQNLSRTILTSGTTLAAGLSLYILGNQIIKDFALSLVFGVIVGTYSSIFVASALVLEYNLLKKK